MFQYQTSIQNRPPLDFGQRALDGLRDSPYEAQYGSQHSDILRSRGAANAADYQVNADKINSQYDLAQQRAEQAAIAQGLQMMADDKKRQQDLENNRLSVMQGFANGILGGLF